MNSQEMIEQLEKMGYEWSLHHVGNEYTFSVCRPEWVTSNLYAARVLPTGRAETEIGAIRAVYDEVIKADHD
jgi:hypothetical protein